MKTFVIGATRGVGRATALELAARGHDLALGYVSSTDAVEKLAAELHGAVSTGAVSTGAVTTVAVQGDVACDGARMVAEAAAGLGGLDNVVVTAVPLITGPIGTVTRQDAERAMDVTVHGFRDVALAAREHMSSTAREHLAGRGGGGAIVGVSSLGSDHYAAYYGALGPAKAALESTVRYLAGELGPELIRVNAVSPCLIDDPAHFDDAPQIAKFLAAAARRTPLGRRLAVPADIARVIAALLGEDLAYVTGQTIVADGGYSLLA